MFFFLLDIWCWTLLSLFVWCVQYLGPVALLVQLIRLIRADADLSLLTYAKLGKAPASLRGQVVWVTGASSGIGEHLIYELAKAGCKLVLSARREEELNRVKQKCLELPGKYREEDFMVLPFDLLDEEKHSEMTQSVVKTFGRIDILVNNGARSQRAWIKDTPIEVDREIIDILVLAQLSLTKAVLPQFLKQGSGHFVITSSLAGKLGAPYSATYTLGKHALQGFFEAMRMEHSSDNIDVTLICPGPVHTNIRQNSFTAEQGQIHGVAQQTKERRMTSERCAELMAVAMANKLGEAWLSPHPGLLFTYVAQYVPHLYQYLAVRYGMKAAENVRQAAFVDQKNK